MSTSLSAQLKKLALPDAQISLSSDFKQASFLYDDREAAKYDKQHFYNIGVNGLQQLISKDERFMEFESNLFSLSSQSIQRLTQSSEVNKQLDEMITKFLLLLSPYMQLREAHKAIEWLVNRYNIHLRNVDVLMMCLLPFHDQESFIMGLRLLKMNTKSCNQWKWLESVKKANTYLPQKTLVSHCRSANGFMGFLCNMLSKHIEANKDSNGNPSAKHLVRVISFFTQTILSVIMDGVPSEQTISVLIPTLSAGFKAKGLPDYTVSSYMIFSQLLTSCTISESLLNSILNVICKNIVPDLLYSAISVIVLMFQKQEISKVSKKALRYLSRNHTIISVFSDLSKNVKMEPFLTPFLSALTSSALRKYSEGGSTSESGTDSDDVPRVSPLSLLMNILMSVSLDKKSVSIIARTVINWFTMNSVSDTPMDLDDESDCKNGPLEVFRLLERKYSPILDDTISEMVTSDETGEYKTVIENLQLQSVRKAQQDLKLDPTTFITICLNHHHGTVRKQAVQRLLQNTSGIEDKTSLQLAVVSRLQDDDLEVVDAVLQDPKNLWELFEDKYLLYDAMVKKLTALEKSRTKETSDLRKKVLQTICCMPKTEAVDMIEMTVLITSYLVPRTLDEVNNMQSLLSAAAAYTPLLSNLHKEWMKEVLTLQKKLKGVEILSLTTAKLIDHIATFLVKNETVKEMISLYECVSKTPRSGSAMMIMCLVNLALIKRVKDLNVKTGLQKLLVTSIKDATMTQKLIICSKTKVSDCSSLEAVISSCLSELKKSSCLDIDLVAFCLENINLDGTPHSMKDKKFWQLSMESSTESNWLWTEVTLFNFLLELSSHNNIHVSKLSQKIFAQFLKGLGDTCSLMKILCALWINKVNGQIFVAHQARSLQFAQVYLNSLSKIEKTKLVCNESIPILPCLLVLMSGRSENARRVCFNLMATLSNGIESSESIFCWFSSNLLKYRHEVENDVAFLPQVLQNILEVESNIEPPAAKKRKSSGSKAPMSSLGLQHLMDILIDPCTPSVVKLGVLHSFSRLDSPDSFVPLMGFLHSLLEKSLKVETADEKAALRMLIKLILKHITPNVAQCMTVKSDVLAVVQLALYSNDMVLACGDTVQMMTAAQLSRRLLSSLPPGSCQAIFSQLLDIMTTSPNTAMVRSCRKVIKHMKLHSKLVVTEFSGVLVKEMATTVRETKRQKVLASSLDQESDVFESKTWKRITTLLEMIQNKKKIIDAANLVPVAFQVLGRVLELETKSSGEYIKQLLLSTIYKICSANNVDDDDNAKSVTGEHLNMELVVQCIRSSDNPHTHHQALLLLSVAAKIAPSLLLHNMMSVFTFMGASILRQDDEYSFHVIERILENVIPAIRMACEEKSRGNVGAKKKVSKKAIQQSEDMMTVVLRVFVDAIPHIPAHRKIMLFQKLLTIVGVDSYMWRVILLVVENVVKRPKTVASEQQHEDEQTSGPLPSGDAEFLSSLCEAFSSLHCFNCIASAINYLMQLPEDKVGENDKTLMTKTKDMKMTENFTDDDKEIFSIPHRSAKQLRHFKYGSIFALTQLMGSQHLVAELSHADPESFLTQYQSMMETVLQFISQVTKSHDQHQQDSAGRFWKIFLHKCHDLLDNMVNLLPDSMFMTVVSGLMDHSLPQVQKRSMDLLNAKLQYFKDSGVPSQLNEMLLTIVDKLERIVKDTLLPKGKAIPQEEDVVNGQTAIYGLKVLCRILGTTNHEPFLKILKLCVKALSRHKDISTVSASAMLCVAEVVSAAKVHSIEQLEELMPLVISQLKTTAVSEHGVLLLAAVTSLQKIIEAVPLFLSPYLSDIVVQICIVNAGIQGDSNKLVVLQKVKLICTTLATATSTRKFLPLLEKSFAALQDILPDCAERLMSMLKEHIDNMSREDMATFSQDLLKFFFACFNIRSEKSGMKSSQATVVEGFVIEAFLTLVFKLSEVQFKPMLLQLYCWATDADASKNRVLTFYRLCSSLAEKLKNLFTLFAGHILKHSTEVLNANNKARTACIYFGKGKKAKKNSCRLIEYILSCLQKTFIHDTEGFMTPERFEIVMQPIVDQLENTLGKADDVDERVEKFLVPCISSLAAAAKDDSLWKEMNHQILLKTRNGNEKVRMRALSAVDSLHKQLGEDYTHLVPETIPFIAELMEDESDEVEKYTQKVIAAMEISVGENLQEYF